MNSNIIDKDLESKIKNNSETQPIVISITRSRFVPRQNRYFLISSHSCIWRKICYRMLEKGCTSERWKKTFYGTIFHRLWVRFLFFLLYFVVRCMQLPQQPSQENEKTFFSRFTSAFEANRQHRATHFAFKLMRCWKGQLIRLFERMEEDGGINNRLQLPPVSISSFRRTFNEKKSEKSFKQFTAS